MTYTLSICIGIWLGMCTAHNRYDFPDRDECLAAQKVVQQSAKPPAWTVCAPKEKQ